MMHLLDSVRRIVRSPHTYALLTVSACAILVGVSILSRINDIGQPFGGFLFDYDSRNSDYPHTVNTDTPFWWSGLQQARLQPHDKIMALNQSPYRHEDGAQWRLAAQSPQPVEIVVQRNGQALTLPIHILTFNWSDWVDLEAPLIITALCDMLLAIAVYLARPHDPFNRVLAGCMFFFGMALRLAAGTLFDSVVLNTRYITEMAWIIIQPFLSALIIHLALLMGQQPEFWKDLPAQADSKKAVRQPRWMPLLRGVYALAICQSVASFYVVLCLWGSCPSWANTALANLAPIGNIDHVVRDSRLFGSLFSGVILLARILFLWLRHRKLPVLLQALGAVAIIKLGVLSPIMFNDWGLLGYHEWVSVLASAHLAPFAAQFAFALLVFRNQKLQVGPNIFWWVMVISSSACISIVILIVLHSVIGADLMRVHAQLIFGLVFSGLLAGVMLWGRTAASREDRLRQLPQRLLNERENEQARIRNELHDSTQNALTALRMRLENRMSHANSRPNPLSPEWAHLPEEMRQIELDLRGILKGLAPVPMDRSLIESLRELCKDHSKRLGFDVQTHFDDDIENRLDAGQRTALYRVIQESLNNVYKHAHASQVRVHVWSDAILQQVCFEIQDNGVGFDRKQPRPNGIGLISMEDRIAAVNGHLRVQTMPGAGTRVAGALPVSLGK